MAGAFQGLGVVSQPENEDIALGIKSFCWSFERTKVSTRYQSDLVVLHHPGRNALECAGFLLEVKSIAPECTPTTAEKLATEKKTGSR